MTLQRATTRAAVAPSASGTIRFRVRRVSCRPGQASCEIAQAMSAIVQPPAKIPPTTSATCRGSGRVETAHLGDQSPTPYSASRATSAPGLGHQDVARPRRQEVRHVEARRAPHHARHALLEQQPRDQVRLRLLRRAGHRARAGRACSAVDLARALVRLAERLLDHLAAARARAASCSVAEALARRRARGRTTGRRGRRYSMSMGSSATCRPRFARPGRPARSRARRSGRSSAGSAPG